MSTDDTPEARSVDEASSILPGFLARSFLAKFLVALLLISVVIVGVSANTYNQTSNQLTEETRTEYIGVANQSAAQIADWRESRSDTTRRLSQFEVVRSGTQQERQAFLQSEKEQLPEDVHNVHLVNLSNANITASTDESEVGQNLNTREAPWQTQTELVYNSDGVFISSAEEALTRSLVSFVTPVETTDGENRYLVVQADMDALAGSLPAPSEDVYSQVVDSQGRIVAGTQETQALDRNDGSLSVYTENPDQLGVLQSGLNGQTEFVQGSDINGTTAPSHGSFAVAFAPVAGEDWVVATHVPLSTAYALRSTITTNLLVLSGAAFFGIAVIGIVFGRGATSALNRLTEKAERLEAGNLDIDLEVTRRDEFGQLTASFANMRDALRDRIQEAESARKEAEVSRQEALAMTDYLQEKAEDYSEVMQRCANGDLTQRMEIDNENDAMDRIAEEFNDMLGELEKTTGQLKTFSEEVAESSEIVLTNTENVRQSGERVTDSIEAINADATDQEARLEELAADLDGVIDRLHSLKGNPHVDINEELAQFQSVADVLEQATGRSQSIRTEAESAAETSKQQADELDEVSERADRLKRYAKPLGGILDRFETAAEHEFVFSGGPSQPVDNDD
ncbi:HAMP domain-containing protein [Haloarcula onubensis]|uniref:histidine kinase n=1 Tax=Haloarcula onubensis TaxID=2950539 RepID=A0ABU2FN36_9EURY|nr:HAMP domain-containing protein [Halomicroarcula sp. S3CR25-11]MDS0282170.1 HAMP domain-containing protein [Halomicroarcula sp. S3CR25-11]